MIAFSRSLTKAEGHGYGRYTTILQRKIKRLASHTMAYTPATTVLEQRIRAIHGCAQKALSKTLKRQYS